MPNPPPKEDTWVSQLYGTPFPEMPVKCFGEQNQYVALCHKHGKPIHGRAWNNNGVVEASFPYSRAELTGAKDLGGQIQVLQYKGNHKLIGFWYNWIKYSKRFDKPDGRQLLKCGDSLPILWKNRLEGPLLGNLDVKTEIASFSHDKVSEQISGMQLNDMLIVVRELRGSQPGCKCVDCEQMPVSPLVTTLNWADFRVGDDFPVGKAVRALNRSLDTVSAEIPDQFVALWFHSGEPVMGRVWNEAGKIAASFSCDGCEYRNVGSFQILFHVRGLDYDWRQFSEAAKLDGEEWLAVCVKGHKGSISPGVVMIDGKELLGEVDVRNERASVRMAGAEKLLVGAAVHSSRILCRRA